MRTIAVPMFMILAGGLLPAPGQQGGRSMTVISPGELLQRRQEYNQALKDWDQSDPTLEKELFSAPADQVLRRIDAAEEKRKAASAAKARYVDAVRQRYEQQLKMLDTPSARGGSDLKEVNKQVLNEVGTSIESVDAEMKRVLPVDRMRYAILQRQKSDLLDLQNLVLQRERALDKMAATEEEFQKSKSAVTENYRKMVELLTAQTAYNREEADNWGKLYSAMRDEVKKKAEAASAAAAARAVKAAPQQAAAVAKATAPVEATAASTMPSLEGRWSFSDPNAKKLLIDGEAIYQISNASINITQIGDQVRGTYSCTYAGAASDSLFPTVDLTFEGRVAGQAPQIALKDPLKGWIRVTVLDNDRVLIAYKVTNASNAKFKISFGEIDESAGITLTREK